MKAPVKQLTSYNTYNQRHNQCNQRHNQWHNQRHNQCNQRHNMRNFTKYTAARKFDDPIDTLLLCDSFRMRYSDCKDLITKQIYGDFMLFVLMPPNGFLEYIQGKATIKYIEEMPFRIFDERNSSLQTAVSTWRFFWENGRINIVKI